MKELTVAKGEICKAILRLRSQSEVGLITCELWRNFFYHCAPAVLAYSVVSCYMQICSVVCNSCTSKD